jgi:hypothetical protein
MRRQTKYLKDLIKDVPCTWVRGWRDGACWIGFTDFGIKARHEQVKELLKEHNIPFTCGLPGTSGEWVLEVKSFDLPL